MPELPLGQLLADAPLVAALLYIGSKWIKSVGEQVSYLRLEIASVREVTCTLVSQVTRMIDRYDDKGANHGSE